MAPPILRESVNKRVCTIEQYNARKDPFHVVARGLPCPWPSQHRCCSKKIASLVKEVNETRINNKIIEIITKYRIKWGSISVHRRHRVGYYGHGIDTWIISCTGDDPRDYKAAAFEIQQVLISAGIPRNDFNVEFTNHELSYCDESYGIPDDPSLIGAIEEIRPKVLQVVRDHLSEMWTSIAYHMRGKKGCAQEEMKPTVIVFCKPNSQSNWSMVEAKIASAVVSKEHPDVRLHLELLPGQVERATLPFITHENDHSNYHLWHKVTRQPKNEASIGVKTDEKLMIAGTLGGWVKLELPDGRSAKCILTTYDVVRNGDVANRTLNDYKGIGLHGEPARFPIEVMYPAPMDIDASKTGLEMRMENKKRLSPEECHRLALLDQLSEHGIGYVVHASGRRIDPSSNRNLDWALIDSPSTFQRNVAPFFNQDNMRQPCEYTVKEGDFIESTSSYQLGERVTQRGRSSCGHASVGRVKRHIRWDDGEESYEDELFGEPGCAGQSLAFADRGDVGSWIVNYRGELVGILSAIDIWTGSPTRSAFVTPIQVIIEDIKKRTGGKISLP